MHLRSGAYIRSGGQIPRDLESESVNQGNLDHLSTIHEEVVSDTSSELSYTFLMEKVLATSFSEEKAVSNAARTPTNQPRKLLQHLYDNGKGARIYLDKKNDSYVQENLGNAVSMSQVEVVLRGDRYFDSNGTTYIRT